MKEALVFIFIMMILGFGVHTAVAQPLTAGIGMMFGTKPDQLGFKADAIYTINEEYRAAFDIGVFFPRKTDFDAGIEIKNTWWELNINGNYMLLQNPELNLKTYAVGGLHFFTQQLDYERPGDDSVESTTFVGINAGAGAEYGLDFALAFAELKYSLSKNPQFNIGFGFRFTFN